MDRNLSEEEQKKLAEQLEISRHHILVSKAIEEEAKGNNEKSKELLKKALECPIVSAVAFYLYAKRLESEGESPRVLNGLLSKAEECLVLDSAPLSLAIKILNFKQKTQNSPLNWLRVEKTLTQLYPDLKEEISKILEPLIWAQKEFTKKIKEKISEILKFSREKTRKSLQPGSIVFLISKQSLDAEIEKGLFFDQKAPLSALPIIEKSYSDKNLVILKEGIAENVDFICLDHRAFQKLWVFFIFPIIERTIDSQGKAILNPSKFLVTIKEEESEKSTEVFSWQSGTPKQVILEAYKDIFGGSTPAFKKLFRKYQISYSDLHETKQLKESQSKTPLEKVKGLWKFELRLLPPKKLHQNGGKMGLKNLGNTCFLNSALQCVLHVSQLRDFFVSGDFETEVNSKSVNGTKGQLVWAFYNLILKSWEMGEKQAEPYEIIKIIQKVSSTFAGFQQQDSQEFLGYFLDALHEDFNRVKQKKYEEAKDYKGENILEETTEAWQFFLRRNNSAIVDLFYGQFVTYTKCPVCPKISYKYDEFNMLTLPLIETKDAIQIFFFPFNRSKGNSSIKAKFHPSTPLFVFLKNLAEKVNADPANLEIVLSLDKKLVNEFPSDLPFCELYKNYGARIVYETRESFAELGEAKPENEERVRVFIDYFYKGARVAYERVVSARLNSSGKEFWEFIFPTIEKCLIASEVLPNEEMDLEKKIRYVIKSGIFSLTNEGKEINYDESPAFSGKVDKNGKVNIRMTFVESFPIGKSGMNSSLHELLFDDGSQTDLQGLIFCSQREHTLDKNNMWYCNECKEHREANRKIGLGKLPKVLIFNFNRFQTVSTFQFRGLIIPRHQKLSTSVSYPIENLDMQPYLDPKLREATSSGTKYRLVGVIKHFGDMGGGHYTASARVGDQWYDFDDSKVNPMRKDQVVASSAYLLFYEME